MNKVSNILEPDETLVIAVNRNRGSLAPTVVAADIVRIHKGRKQLNEIK